MSDEGQIDQKPLLQDTITHTISAYFEQLEGEQPCNVYDMVLKQVEPPVLEATLKYTNNNQSKAAEVLGLNRGTLRKKLKQYDLL